MVTTWSLRTLCLDAVCRRVSPCVAVRRRVSPLLSLNQKIDRDHFLASVSKNETVLPLFCTHSSNGHSPQAIEIVCICQRIGDGFHSIFLAGGT